MATNKDKIRAAAQKYLQKGQIDKAIKEFERLVEDDPNDVRTLLKIGDLQTRKGDQAAATKTYGNVAKYYSDQGFFLKAVAVYKQILKLDPTLVEINLRLAELYHQLGLLSDAIAQYRAICEIYEKEERWEESLQVLNKMAELEPSNLAVRIKLAEVHARLGRTEQAKADFIKAAQQLKAENRIEDYIKVAERLIQLDANDLTTTRDLAALYIQRKDPRRALAKLQVCFRAKPTDIDTLTLLGQAFEDLGQIHKAMSVFKEMAEVHNAAGNQAARQAALRKMQALEASLSLGTPNTGGSATTAILPLSAVGRGPQMTGVNEQVTVVQATYQPTGPATSQTNMSTASAAPAETLQASAAEGSTVAGQPPPRAPGAEDLSKLLVEADIYIKYGLRNKAIEHLEKLLEVHPNHWEAQQRYKNVLLDADDVPGATRVMWTMAQQALQQGHHQEAQVTLEELLEHAPDHQEARAALDALRGAPVNADGKKNGESGEHRNEDTIEPEPLDEHAPPDENITYGLQDGLQRPSVSRSAAAQQPEVILEAQPLPEDDSLILSPPEVNGTLNDELDTDIEIDADALAVAVSGEPEATPTGQDKAAAVVFNLGDDTAWAPHIAHQGHDEDVAIEVETEGPVAPESGIDVESEASSAIAALSTRRSVDLVLDEAELEQQVLVPSNDLVPRQAAKQLQGQSRSDEPRTKPERNDQSKLTSSRPTGATPLSASTAEAVAVSSPAAEAAKAAEEDDLDLSAELDEIDFFYQQGLMDEANEALAALLTFYPDHRGVQAMAARLRGESTESVDSPMAGESNTPAEYPDPYAEGEPQVHIAQVDAALQAELADVNPLEASNEEISISFEDVFEQFKKGVAAQVDHEDYDTHYNLGIAYKEMGLLDDAIREFEITAAAPALEINALMMIGLCQLERGSTEDALRYFMRGLSSQRVTAREVVALRYEVGLAYETMGRYADAVKFYEKASAMDPTFRDVGHRLSEAQGRVDDGPSAESGELDALLGDTPAGARKSAKISYL